MRKFAVYGASALLVVSAVAGAAYAQEATETPTVPETTVLPQMTQQRTWLGIRVEETDNGVAITQVSANSPAETAQLEVGDIILEVNGTAVESVSDLQAVIQAAASGDVLAFAVQRGEDQLNVDVTLSTRETSDPFAMSNDPLRTAQRMLDVELTVVDEGYQVVSVNDNASFDLAVGDVITAVNGESVTSLDWATLRDSSADAEVTLTVTRDGEEVTLTGTLTAFGGRDGAFPGGQPNRGEDRPGGAPQNNGRPGGNRQPGDNHGQPGGAPPGTDSQPADSGAGDSA